jgi:hypothetical protein
MPRRFRAMLLTMKQSSVFYLVVFLLSACATTASREPGGAVLDQGAQAKAIQEALEQAADVAVNRLGRLDGFNANPRVRIPLPDEFDGLQRGLRRLGMQRYVDDFVLAMNRAAETAVPAAKPVLIEAVRNMSVTDAVSVLHGDEDAATRYFRGHTEASLRERLRPLVAEATARADVTAAYKRLLKKASLLGRSVNLARFDLDTYVTNETLAGLYVLMAEEERKIRRDPLARGTELLKKAFR